MDKAFGQADPTNASPINFTVTFNENVSDFTASDLTLGGSAGATSKVVTGGPQVYNVAVSGMTSDGDVTLTFTGSGFRCGDEREPGSDLWRQHGRL